MNKSFDKEAVHSVMGGEVIVHGETYTPYSGPEMRRRTPLHVEFSDRTNCAPAQVIENLNDPELFNAIGSLCTHSIVRSHLPLLDVDGGAMLEYRKSGQRLILGAKHGGTYGPRNSLRDVLGDHQVDVEIFEGPVFAEDRFLLGKPQYRGSQVGAVLLRARKDMFEVVPSSTEGHSHVYIQEEFTDEENRELISSLQQIGIVSRAWADITSQDGMAVLRTPWTEKEQKDMLYS